MPRLQLKQPTGWFATGREVAEALMLLPDAAFRLYIYICLNADRHTGKLTTDPASVARVLRRERAAIEDELSELASHGVCRRSGGVLEICERFWPYHRQSLKAPDNSPADYVRSAREVFLEPGCVCSAFTPADEKVAAGRYIVDAFAGFGWSLLPGAPALTRTGRAPARRRRLSGRTILLI